MICEQVLIIWDNIILFRSIQYVLIKDLLICINRN